MVGSVIHSEDERTKYSRFVDYDYLDSDDTPLSLLHVVSVIFLCKEKGKSTVLSALAKVKKLEVFQDEH